MDSCRRSRGAGAGRRLCHQLEAGACTGPSASINRDRARLCCIEKPPMQPSTSTARAGRRLSRRDAIVPYRLSRPLKLGDISPSSAEAVSRYRYQYTLVLFGLALRRRSFLSANTWAALQPCALAVRLL